VEEYVEFKWDALHRVAVRIDLTMLERFHCRGRVFSIERKAKVGEVDELAMLQKAIEFMEGVDPEAFFSVGEKLRGMRAAGMESRTSLERIAGEDPC
jgi:hypothetical protein